MSRIPLTVVGLRFGGALIREHLSQQIDFELRGVCDRDGSLAEKLAAEVGTTASASLEDVLADPDSGVIGLFTPPEGRAELIQRAIEAGRDVITTKPFETSAQAARSVLNRAQELGRHVLLNSPPPLARPELGEVQRWVEQSQLGAVVAARAATWTHYRESPDGTWYDDPARCPYAPLMRLGVYALHDLLELCGRPVEVLGLSARQFTERPTADHAVIALRFENGALGTVQAHFNSDDGVDYPDDWMVQYERGTVRRLDRASLGEPGQRVLRLTRRVAGRPFVEEFEVDSPQPHGAYPWSDFARILRGEVNATLDPDVIVWGVQVVEALRALEKGASSCSLEPLE